MPLLPFHSQNQQHLISRTMTRRRSSRFHRVRWRSHGRFAVSRGNAISHSPVCCAAALWAALAFAMPCREWSSLSAPHTRRASYSRSRTGTHECETFAINAHTHRHTNRHPRTCLQCAHAHTDTHKLTAHTLTRTTTCRDRRPRTCNTHTHTR